MDRWEREKGLEFVYSWISFMNLFSWQRSNYRASHLCCLNCNSAYFSFQAGAGSHILTCHLADSAHDSARFCLSLSLPNLYPESNNPYNVSLVGQASAAKSCFLLTFILKVKARCQVPGHRTSASFFIAAKLWVTMSGFYRILAAHIKLVYPNSPGSKGKGVKVIARQLLNAIICGCAYL